MTTSRFAAVVGFGVLCGIAIVRGVRHRHVASLWLALAFAGIVVTASMASRRDDLLQDQFGVITLDPFQLPPVAEQRHRRTR